MTEQTLSQMTIEELTQLLIALRTQMKEMSDTATGYMSIYRRWSKVSDEITSRQTAKRVEGKRK